jgi:hypothetical protein
MVIAGIKNIKIEGARIKKLVKLDSPISSKLLFPGDIHRKKPVEIRKKNNSNIPSK